jgi:hypothetical protein
LSICLIVPVVIESGYHIEGIRQRVPPRLILQNGARFKHANFYDFDPAAPERAPHNWQNSAARLIAPDILEKH